MSLFITTKQNGFSGSTEYHLGAGQLQTHILDMDKVTAVQADGDELEMIQKQLAYFPISLRARVQIWRGDLAKFIVDNVTL
jgi:hypothetical protein